MEQLRYWIGFNRAKGIGPSRLRALIQHFGSIEAAWNAPLHELARLLDSRTLNSLSQTRQQIDLDAELHAVERCGARLITFDDPEYPPLLRQIHDPPPLLYVKGTLTPDDANALAVVGTRAATDYGRAMTVQLVEPLARHGLTIVSGLALGIDGVAHHAALHVGGRTVAVLPCGIDRVYPPEHAHLAEQIAAQGALITEFALGTRPDRNNFAPRNRIVSGVARGVLVIEAAEHSGALITVDSALEQGREVFAVPGSALSSASAGTNALIRSGARMITNAAEILEELAITPLPDALAAPPGQVPAGEIGKPRQHDGSGRSRTRSAQAAPAAPASAPPQDAPYEPADATEAALLRFLAEQGGTQHIDTIVQGTGLPIMQVAGALTLLELKGAVRQVGAMDYTLA